MKKLFIFIVTVILVPISVSAASIKCTKLTSDLVQGASGSSVLALQNYLQLSGFLSATPNGTFGPATLSAVKKFQTANGITATGTVGPITRLAIQVKSCEPVKMEPIPVTPTTDNLKPRSAVSINTPESGNKLTLGKDFTIRWGSGMSSSDSLVLETEDGTSKGYVAFFPGSNEEYVWDVGTVMVGNSNEVVEPGTYRIRVQDKLRGPFSNDPRSAFFTIVAPDLVASSVVPSSISSGGKASAVIFGSGFNTGTRVYFDATYGDSADVLFVSPDGTIIVFSVPSNISSGNHRIILRNQYGTAGNELSLKIN